MAQRSTINVHVQTRSERAISLSSKLLAELFGPAEQRLFAVRFWDGEVEVGSVSPPPFTLVLNHPGSLRRMLLPPSEIAMVEAYLSNAIDIEGDLEAASTIGDIVARRLRSARTLTRVLTRVLTLPTEGEVGDAELRRRSLSWFERAHTPRRDAAAIRFHYDVGNDFFALFLDQRMVYSCAYFPTGTEDIDTAQEAKLEHVCRKLRLRPGERLLDIGCGWGGLMIHAATRFGVEVLGVTLSEAQARYAREQIASRGLSDRCRVEVRDYRHLEETAYYDKISSVGVVEHLGRVQMPTYFRVTHRLLKPGGLALNHTLVRVGDARLKSFAQRVAHRLWGRGQFVDRYVFPDVQPLPVHEVLRHAEQTGFETRDVESLRDHYVLTARHWVRRLERRRAEAASLLGEAGYRVWRLYMAAGARVQRSGADGIVQLLMAKPDMDGRTGLPLTRSDLYRT